MDPTIDLTRERADAHVARVRRSLLLALLLVAVLALGWLLAQPYFVLGQIRDAANRGDRDALTDLVDFPRLRDNLKASLNAQMASATAKDSEGNPFAALGTLLGGAIVDRAVDAYVTPAGIAELSRGQRPDLAGDSTGGKGFANRLTQGYVSFSSFHATVVSDSGGVPGVVFVLRRHGLSWVLTDIELPVPPSPSSGSEAASSSTAPTPLPSSAQIARPPSSDHRPTTPRQAKESSPRSADQDDESQVSIETLTPSDNQGLTIAKPEGLPGPKDYVYAEELPEAILKVAPEYPDAARQSSIEGTVIVTALVGTDGRVKDTEVVKSVPALDGAAQAAVKQWRFKPARTNGSPVAIWVSVPVKFTLN